MSVTNYTLTKRAKQGFLRVGALLHIQGMDNIVSFIIWNMLDITPVSKEDIESAKAKCIKRLNYVYTPERATVAISLSPDTKEYFEKIYIAAGIGSASAALDLIGLSIFENGFVDAEKYQFVNDITNPFYIYRKDNYVSIRAHKTNPRKHSKVLFYDEPGDLAPLEPAMEPDGSITFSPDKSDTVITDTKSPAIDSDAFKAMQEASEQIEKALVKGIAPVKTSKCKISSSNVDFRLFGSK